MAVLVVVSLLAGVTSIFALDSSQCIAPLGMESGAIPDQDISASSSFDSGNVGPQNGRVRTESHGGAWCPKNQITTEPKEWIEIDLHTVHVITATETQGRFGNGQGQEFTEAYQLEYWRPKLGKWVRYRDMRGNEVIEGNSNTYLEAKRELDPPIWASRIRFLPYSYHRRTVCMRVEIYGCYWNDGIVSYSMPQGDKRGAYELFDATYDGHWDTELERGLGQLTDGKVSFDSFKTSSHYDKAGRWTGKEGWVGWRNDTRAGQPLEIKFEFDRVREFNALHIFCNNQFTKDIQVFSEMRIMFSIGGLYYLGDPITYTYMEDRIFENPRNISIKLHRRIGRFVKLQLHFASKWLMISEVTFDSDVAHGNFTPETAPGNDIPVQSDVFIDKESNTLSDNPVSTAHQDDHTFMAVIIGILLAVILLLAAVIYLIVSRHNKRKCFASPLNGKPGLPPLTPSHAPSTCGTASDKSAYKADTALLVDHTPMKGDDYQEPYQALKYAPYYSYSTVVMEMRDTLAKTTPPRPTESYEYAVPEVGRMPLLGHDSIPRVPVVPPVIPPNDPPPPTTPNGNLFQRTTLKSLKDDHTKTSKSTSSQQEVLTALKQRLEQTSVPEFPRHRLRMLTKLGEGAFGTVYVAEADGILEYNSSASLGKRLVAVKFLLHNASEKEKLDFHRDVRILAALEDHNIARVLGTCVREEPYCVIMEYSEHGDLTQFLKTHVQAENTRNLPIGVKTLSFNCLLYMATQIASGMRYLETLNFVHRDLATRNCLVGKAYQIKISDFGTDNEIYAEDYYKVDEGLVLPVRWMAWESICMDKYTTKSDVWSFGVTLWEILNLARSRPYDSLSDDEVVSNLEQMQVEEDGRFMYLARPPPPCTKDISDLMLECWRRNDSDRPSFREIHLFLQRKNLGYAPVS